MDPHQPASHTPLSFFCSSQRIELFLFVFACLETRQDAVQLCLRLLNQVSQLPQLLLRTLLQTHQQKQKQKQLGLCFQGISDCMHDLWVVVFLHQRLDTLIFWHTLVTRSSSTLASRSLTATSSVALRAISSSASSSSCFFSLLRAWREARPSFDSRSND